jgi:hypothetical protein
MGILELELRPVLRVEIIQQEHSLFRERQIVKLYLEGSIVSRLTQHRITGGTFKIQPVGEFLPEGGAGQAYGLLPVPAAAFDPFQGNLPVIEPRREVPVRAQLVSNRAIPLETNGLGAWLKSASKGLTVTFRGQAAATFSSLQAEFDRSQMEGIFGASAAPEIFKIPQRLDVRSDVSNAVPIAFELRSGYGRMLLFTLLILLALGGIFLLYWFFGRPFQYRVRVGDQESFVQLRRLQSHAITAEGHLLGTLRRGLMDEGHFVPNRSSVAVTITAGLRPGTFDVALRDRPSLQLELERVGGSPVPLKEAKQSGPSGPTSSGRIRPPGAPPAGGAAASKGPNPGSTAPGGSPSGPPSQRPTIRRPDQR